jgi:hypothetical protein
VAIPRQGLLDLSQESLLIERDLGQKQDVRSAAFLFSG